MGNEIIKQNARVIDAKKEIMVAFESLKSAKSIDAIAKLDLIVKLNKNILAGELHLRIKEYEQSVRKKQKS